MALGAARVTGATMFEVSLEIDALAATTRLPFGALVAADAAILSIVLEVVTLGAAAGEARRAAGGAAALQ